MTGAGAESTQSLRTAISASFVTYLKSVRSDRKFRDVPSPVSRTAAAASGTTAAPQIKLSELAWTVPPSSSSLAFSKSIAHADALAKSHVHLPKASPTCMLGDRTTTLREISPASSIPVASDAVTEPSSTAPESATVPPAATVTEAALVRATLVNSTRLPAPTVSPVLSRQLTAQASTFAFVAVIVQFTSSVTGLSSVTGARISTVSPSATSASARTSER